MTALRCHKRLVSDPNMDSQVLGHPSHGSEDLVTYAALERMHPVLEPHSQELSSRSQLCLIRTGITGLPVHDRCLAQRSYVRSGDPLVFRSSFGSYLLFMTRDYDLRPESGLSFDVSPVGQPSVLSLTSGRTKLAEWPFKEFVARIPYWDHRGIR